MELWSIQGVAERWKRAYCPRGVWRNDTAWKGGKSYITDRESVYQAIIAANGDPDPIGAAIGNETWTSFHCGECDERKTVGVEFDNGDGQTVVVCKDCLQKSLSMCNEETSADRCANFSSTNHLATCPVCGKAPFEHEAAGAD